ncbi:hypothetical protein AMTRI_Chr03g51070 [Amborella trichopoda]
MAKSCESSMLSCRIGRLKLRNAKRQSSHSKSCSAQTQAIENLTNEDWIHVEWLVIFHLGSKCSALENQCAYHECVNARRIWMHISSCQSVHCLVTLCQPLRKLWGHYCHWKVDLISREEAMSSELLEDVQHPLKRMRVEQSESAIPSFTNEDCTNEVQYPISEHTSQVKGDISFTSSGGLSSQATNEDCTERNEGASLLEYFIPEQIRTHINSLRQFVGPTKSKAEQCQEMQNSSNQSRCQLCCMEHLSFALREAIYYTTSNGGKQSYICPRCFRGACGESIEVEGFQVFKSNFVEKTNIDELNEEWVQCSGCGSWNHQICALFNKRSYSGQTEYACPYCFLKEVEGGKQNPLPQSDLHSAKDLPTTILSDHLEQRLLRRLKLGERRKGKSIREEVPGAKDLVIRVFLSVDQKLQVNQHFLEIVKDESYSSEFPYKSKAILLFQKIEGVDVCLFCMYVQEYGSECPYPNNRRVCLSYVDSVKYFQPAIKSITGEALRTFVYSEILVGYLEYCKRRGFMSCHIWVCPPTKEDDYILYCHPEIQKTPKLDRLHEDIVVEHTNMYEQFFVRTGEKKAKVTLTSVPYFDGNYFSRRADGKTPASKVAPKYSTQVIVANDTAKVALLTQKLGDSISKKREDFIVVHMQHACKYCGEFELSRKLRVCMLCENFYLCENCYEAKQNVDCNNRIPCNRRGKHSFSLVEMNDPPSTTKDKDAFLGFCVDNHLQFDTLRRAKHSSFVIIDTLHDNFCKSLHCQPLKGQVENNEVSRKGVC